MAKNKNQARPGGPGHGPGRGHGYQRPQNLRGTVGKLLAYIGRYKAALIVVASTMTFAFLDFLRNQVLKNAYGNDDTVIAALDPRILLAWYLFFGLVPWFVSDIPFLLGCFLPGWRYQPFTVCIRVVEQFIEHIGRKGFTQA